MLASAAAAASGLPPYDEDDPLGLAQGFACAIAPFATTPLMGKPAPNALPTVMMSGVTPLRSQANQRPVRPNPGIISSEMNSAPGSLAISSARTMNSTGGTTLPAVPCRGSMITAATLPVLCCLSCSRARSAQAMPQLGYLSLSGQR